jgi:UDP-N-acetylglucosamine 1-carboxyvinyltransferase
MDKLEIHGGPRLSGTVPIAGAKNAALPALAASLLSAGPLHLSGLPGVRDVRTMVRVLEQLGAEVERGEKGSAVSIRVEKILHDEAPYDLVKTMRASVLVLGPLLARHGRARVSMPGGCAIGERPINFHLAGLEKMGATIELDHGYVEAHVDRLHGASISFPQKSVTGTENLMMAATLAEGTTQLHNCAQEPEIVDLARLLRAMGAEIEGEGSDVIRIEGKSALGEASYRVMADRIEAGTYLVAGALIGDNVRLENAPVAALGPVLEQLEEVGVQMTVDADNDTIVVEGGGDLVSRDMRTSPHPGFPTDMQAQYMVLMNQSRGTSVIAETIFERRFMHVPELLRMGADIRIDGSTAVVVGPQKLTGAQVMATDLRASASLVLAGLVADGVTVIDRVYHLDRGYERMEEKLKVLGADVRRVR